MHSIFCHLMRRINFFHTTKRAAASSQRYGCDRHADLRRNPLARRGLARHSLTPRPCLMLAVQADVATICTVEGLAPGPGRLAVLQEAFRRHHALQCGFCTAGILMSLDIYLRAHSDPSEQELRKFLGGHLCRCTGYVPIVAAALDAATRLREVRVPHV
jgi:xanthine dehydrogenase iron-sulfur cluster and FAD-binding subunit A